MKPSALLAIALCLSACGTVRPVLESDSTRVEVKTVVETIHDTAYVQLPVIVERVAESLHIRWRQSPPKSPYPSKNRLFTVTL